MVRHRPIQAPGFLTAPSSGFQGSGASYGERADLYLAAPRELTNPGGDIIH